MNNAGHSPMDELLRMKRQMESQNLSDKQREQEMLRFAGRNMGQQEQKKLRSILQDRDALQELLSSEKAQNLLRKLQNKD